MKKKPDGVKIIQIISHAEGLAGGDYVYGYEIIGLGDDSRLYQYNSWHHYWFTDDPLPVDKPVESG